MVVPPMGVRAWEHSASSFPWLKPMMLFETVGLNKTCLRRKTLVLAFVLHAMVLVLVSQVLCCVVKYSFVTLVVIMILEGHSNFSIRPYYLSFLCSVL